MTIAKTTRSIPEIFGDVVNDFTILVRKETQLARVEMSEKLSDVGLGIGLLVGGSVLLIPALVILLQAAVAGLVAAGIASAWAALIVGGAVLLIGFILLGLGVSLQFGLALALFTALPAHAVMAGVAPDSPAGFADTTRITMLTGPFGQCCTPLSRRRSGGASIAPLRPRSPRLAATRRHGPTGRLRRHHRNHGSWPALQPAPCLNSGAGWRPPFRRSAPALSSRRGR